MLRSKSASGTSGLNLLRKCAFQNGTKFCKTGKISKRPESPLSVIEVGVL